MSKHWVKWTHHLYKINNVRKLFNFDKALVIIGNSNHGGYIGHGIMWNRKSLQAKLKISVIMILVVTQIIGRKDSHSIF